MGNGIECHYCTPFHSDRNYPPEYIDVARRWNCLQLRIGLYTGVIVVALGYLLAYWPM